jgi:hypothetical protein
LQPVTKPSKWIASELPPTRELEDGPAVLARPQSLMCQAKGGPELRSHRALRVAVYRRVVSGPSNRFGNDSRHATDRTLPRLPVQHLISSHSRHPAFIQVNPRNMQQLPQAVISVRNSGVLSEERLHELRWGHVDTQFEALPNAYRVLKP